MKIKPHIFGILLLLSPLPATFAIEPKPAQPSGEAKWKARLEFVHQGMLVSEVREKFPPIGPSNSRLVNLKIRIEQHMYYALDEKHAIVIPASVEQQGGGESTVTGDVVIVTYNGKHEKNGLKWSQLNFKK